MNNIDFQTPPVVAQYMASFLPLKGNPTILEPTPGAGNIVRAIKHGKVIAPDRFENLPKNSRYDWAIMNPPFTPMKEGHRFLSEVMEMTDNIIALLPWFILINSERRINSIMDFGLVSITHLPRKTFPRSRIQCCVLEMKKSHQGGTEFKKFNW